MVSYMDLVQRLSCNLFLVIITGHQLAYQPNYEVLLGSNKIVTLTEKYQCYIIKQKRKHGDPSTWSSPVWFWELWHHLHNVYSLYSKVPNSNISKVMFRLTFRLTYTGAYIFMSFYILAANVGHFFGQQYHTQFPPALAYPLYNSSGKTHIIGKVTI